MKKLNKAMIFDAGALITISMNGLDKELRALKNIFDGAFLITRQVKKEVIDKPLTIKNFELEALRTKKLLEDKIIELAEDYGVDDNSITIKTEELMEIANSFFMSPKEPVKLLHIGEASCLALSSILNKKNIKNVIVIDERTARMLIEKPENLRELLIRKLHTNIRLVKNNFNYFKDFQVIRSAELIYVAWKRGLVDLKNGTFLLDALLYAVKSKGCAISHEEIEEIKKIK